MYYKRLPAKRLRIIETSPGGFEPPTFRLTAERANPLRHRDDGVLLLGFAALVFAI